MPKRPFNEQGPLPPLPLPPADFLVALHAASKVDYDRAFEEYAEHLAAAGGFAGSEMDKRAAVRILKELVWLVEARIKYGCCRVCGGPLSEERIQAALKGLQTETCSTACVHTEIKKRHACCSEAEFHPCVCLYSFTCAKHGITHVGTHD